MSKTPIKAFMFELFTTSVSNKRVVDSPLYATDGSSVPFMTCNNGKDHYLSNWGEEHASKWLIE